MQIEVKVINSFSIDGTGGNPAGLVMNADSLKPHERQLVARKVGLSEVAFLSKSRVSDYKVEFFTPTKQIPHCGHATIAAFSYLKSSGVIAGSASSKETVDGTRKIIFEANAAYMQQSPAEFSSVGDERRILASLGITRDLLDRDLPVVIGSTGNAYLLIPLRDERNLKDVSPDFAAIEQISKELNLTGYYVFSQVADNFDAQARMFAPAFGIDEESATGMGAGPLAAYLYRYGRSRKVTYIIGQGRYMSTPSPSRITVHIDSASGGIMAGGNAYVVKTIYVEIENG